MRLCVCVCVCVPTPPPTHSPTHSLTREFPGDGIHSTLRTGRTVRLPHSATRATSALWHADNKLGDAAGVAFAEALKVNATLQSLNLLRACVVPAALRVEGGKALARVCAADMCVFVCVCV